MIEPPLQIGAIYTGSFVGVAQLLAAPTNSNTGDDWWVSRPYKSDPFVGAARITSRSCCFICRGGWCLGTRARHCRGGSITSRPYKKFDPLLKIVFYVVKDRMKKGCAVLEQGTCPKTGLRTSNQASLSTTLLLVCGFANLLLWNMTCLSFHLHGAGVA